MGNIEIKDAKQTATNAVANELAESFDTIDSNKDHHLSGIELRAEIRKREQTIPKDLSLPKLLAAYDSLNTISSLSSGGNQKLDGIHSEDISTMRKMSAQLEEFRSEPRTEKISESLVKAENLDDVLEKTLDAEQEVALSEEELTSIAMKALFAKQGQAVLGGGCVKPIRAMECATDLTVQEKPYESPGARSWSSWDDPKSEPSRSSDLENRILRTNDATNQKDGFSVKRQKSQK